LGGAEWLQQIIIKSSRAVLKDAVTYDFEVPNGTWTMSLEPHLGWGEGGFLLLFREIVALIFSLLLANMARLLIELKATKHALEKRVDETTNTSVLLKKQLDVLLNTIPDLIWLKDMNGFYLFCNRAFERFFGEKEVNIVGKSDYDFVDIKTADFFRAHDMIAMDADGPVVNEEQLSFKEDGYTGYFETIKTSFCNDENDIVGVLGIARDITKRRENEEKIEKLQYFDALTSLPNRMLLRLRIEHDIITPLKNKLKNQLAYRTFGCLKKLATF
jgi:PAS domain S-box-containing protein